MIHLTLRGHLARSPARIPGMIGGGAGSICTQYRALSSVFFVLSVVTALPRIKMKVGQMRWNHKKMETTEGIQTE